MAWLPRGGHVIGGGRLLGVLTRGNTVYKNENKKQKFLLKLITLRTIIVDLCFNITCSESYLFLT